MKRERIRSSECPAETAMYHVGGKWKFALIWRLSQSNKYRYGELKRFLPGVTERIFIQQLKEMEQSGLIVRRAYDVVPPKVEYSLTPAGLELIPIINALTEWVNRNHITASKQD